ncbi:MAG: KpsF/GutQ family sugar-phosphate isomerase [Armatimonadota bacterium]|nr:KpsF/GutQ family sugar-phosphate isomerase [Armatimonadota bacterium]
MSAERHIDPERVIERARQVLEIESKAVIDLSARVGNDFVAATDLILCCHGKLIVTGIGKSGAIGRKLAGTFSSTGTPSLFFHPAEGVHGDLGAVTGQDLVLLLSYSGETDELIAIMPAVKRMGAKVISLVGNCGSTLGKYADIALDVSVTQEACPLGLAPTASTTAMLALGDALALAVMEVRQFTKEDYAKFHPGGALGRRLTLRVEDVMRTGEAVAVVSESITVRDALFAITKAGAGATNVVDPKGNLIGIITDGDVRRHALTDENFLSKTASEVMTGNPKTITPDRLATEALKIMESLKIGEMPAVKDSKVVGMVMLKDLLEAGIV